MRKVIIASIASIFLTVVIFTASGQAPIKARGFFSVLHVGQSVTLKDTNGRYEIGVFDNGPDLLGYKVVEVGSDYLVVQDVSGVNELRIPVYAVKTVVTLKVPK